MNLELRKFDIAEIKDDKVVVLWKKNTGKSFLCRDAHPYGDSVGQVVGTEANQFYNGCPKLFIHDEFKSEVVQNF